MNLFNRLPGFTRSPAGMERRVLRGLPMGFLVGTLVLALPALVVRIVPVAEESLLVMTTDIYVISLVILHWTIVLTVGIAAFIIMLMKGPAYVADAYQLHEAETLEGPPPRLQRMDGSGKSGP